MHNICDARYCYDEVSSIQEPETMHKEKEVACELQSYAPCLETFWLRH